MSNSNNNSNLNSNQENTMLTVTISLETGIKLANLFVSCGFYKTWPNFKPALTPEAQRDGLVHYLKEEGKDTIFILHTDTGRWTWRTVGDKYSHSDMDSACNTGGFNYKEVQIIKEFLLSNSKPVELTGIDLLYGIAS